MPDMDRLYPHLANDMVAVSATRRSSGAGTINYTAIGAYFAVMVGKGLQSALKKGRKGFDKIIDFLVDNTQVDQDFLDTLGRQNSPYWGSDDWNPTIVPAGYVNRFDAASDTVVLLIGFLLARFVIGRVGVSGIASFAGGQWASYKNRKYRSELRDVLDDIAEDTDSIEGRGRLSRLQDARLDGSFDLALSIAEAFNRNDRGKLSKIVREMKAREADMNLDL